MRSEDIFALGLELLPPCEVKEASFVKEADGSKSLHIQIDFQRGGKFVNNTGQRRKAYDTEDKRCTSSI
ncbi:MAG: hypothetical protein H6544_05455 [Prevotellaceae bacterium]|nr:hypothetical protein [Prevotellaceae bacterium]